jgi:O-acetylhomoserine/O-acetylserine sulfhydrylase-like pyridoxal-dependent enzyme
MAVLGKKLFNKEYVSAVKMYKNFIKRGDSTGQALHRAATTHRHVNERELRKVIDAMGS